MHENNTHIVYSTIIIIQSASKRIRNQDDQDELASGLDCCHFIYEHTSDLGRQRARHTSTYIHTAILFDE